MGEWIRIKLPRFFVIHTDSLFLLFLCFVLCLCFRLCFLCFGSLVVCPGSKPPDNCFSSDGLIQRFVFFSWENFFWGSCLTSAFEASFFFSIASLEMNFIPIIDLFVPWKSIWIPNYVWLAMKESYNNSLPSSLKNSSLSHIWPFLILCFSIKPNTKLSWERIIILTPFFLLQYIITVFTKGLCSCNMADNKNGGIGNLILVCFTKSHPLQAYFTCNVFPNSSLRLN